MAQRRYTPKAEIEILVNGMGEIFETQVVHALPLPQQGEKVFYQGYWRNVLERRFNIDKNRVTLVLSEKREG